MSTRIGTANYIDLRAAQKVYFHMTQSKIDEGSIIIGKPEIKEDERLMVDRRGRYHIKTED